jgi:hypothetical protein
MLINAYDTTVGKPFKVTDQVEATIKALHIARTLVPTKKEGVFCIDYSAEVSVKIFAFPITLRAYNNKNITVHDERPYRNKSNNQVVNSNELTALRLASFLQHDVAEGDPGPLKKMRAVACKGFSESISNRISKPAGLNANESMTLKILLGHYFVSLIEPQGNDVELVTTNVMREVYGADKGFVLGIIDDIQDIGHLHNLEQLLQAINRNPTLYKLKGYELKDLIAAYSGITFAALGSKVIGAACEAPCLFSALTYVAAKFTSSYSRTKLGEALDIKYNKELLKNFTLNVECTYDLW